MKHEMFWNMIFDIRKEIKASEKLMEIHKKNKMSYNFYLGAKTALTLLQKKLIEKNLELERKEAINISSQ
jgi:hypothetical protein